MDPRVFKRGKLRSKVRRKSCGRQTLNKEQCSSSPVDFDSESLSSSSPLKPDVAVMKKTRRKKIRSTQDFNQLDSSLTSQDSDASNKSKKSVKTRKPKGVCFLPIITNLTKDHSRGKENMSPNLFATSITSPSVNTPFKKLKKTPKKRSDISTVISGDTKHATKYLNNKKALSSEDSEKSYNSHLMDSEDDENSEVEIKPKKKGRNEVLIDVNNKSSGDRVKRLKRLLASDSAQTSEEKQPEKATPLKKRSSVLNKSKRRTTRELRKRSKSNGSVHAGIQDYEQDYIDNEQFSDLDMEDAKEEKTQIRKSVRFAEAPKEDNIRRSTFNVDKCSESINLFNKLSAETPEVYNAAPEMEMSVSSKPEDIADFVNSTSKSLSDSGGSNKLNHTFEITSPRYFSMKEMENDSLPSPIQSVSLRNSEKFNSTRGNTTEHSKLSLSMATPKPSFAKLINESENALWKNKSQITIRDPPIIDLITPMHKKLNSSSSEKNIASRKLQKASSSISTHDIAIDKSLNSMSNSYNPESSNLKGNTQISTPARHVKHEDLGENRQKSSVYKANITKSPTPFNKHSRKNSNMTDETLWKNKSEMTIGESSIIDLTTPIHEKLNSSDKNVESWKLQKESTFSISTDNITGFNKSLNRMSKSCNPEGSNLKENAQISTPARHVNLEDLCENRQNSSAYKANITKSPIPYNKHSRRNSIMSDTTDLQENLIQQFLPTTKKSISSVDRQKSLKKSGTPKPSIEKFSDDQKNSQIDVNYFSPIVAKSSDVKPMDTSRITKRKQWDKSRISISFLESSVDINNVSAPWVNDSLNTTFGVTKFTDSGILNNLDFSIKSKGNYEIPPSSSSTPLVKPKNNLLKHVSFKEKNVTVNETKNSSKSSSKLAVKVQRTKMPNFALIHQRAYDKLENLKEMSERKAQRAKLLLSGGKPGAPDNTKVCGKSQKFLQFSPKRSKIPALSAKTEINKKEIVTHSSKVSITKINKISPSRSNTKVAAIANKFNKIPPVEKKKDLLKMKQSRIPTKMSDNVTAERKGFTRYGFKVGSKEVNATKEEQVKAIASKTKVVKNTVDERRKAIQGVRSNRRFELLMNMRKK